MEQNQEVLVVLFFPVLGGILGFCLGRKGKNIRNIWIDFVVMIEFAMLLYTGYLMIGKQAGISLTFAHLLGTKCSLTLNVVRLLFCVITAGLIGVIIQFMKESIKEDSDSNRLYLLYMNLYSMILGAVMADDLFCFLIFVTLVLLCAYPLILHRQDRMVIKSARIYMAFLITAFVFILVGIVMVYVQVGSVDYAKLELYSGQMLNGINNTVLVGGLTMFAGFAIIAGIFPVQFQVTRGCSYSMLEVSAILSCLISKLGIFGMMILAVHFFSANILYGKVLLVAGLLTIIWGLLITLSSTDIRKILMGLVIVTNGFNVLSIALIVLSGRIGYAVHSSILVLMVSSLSLFVLYMIALEQVRKVHTYEINGLIATGKGNKLLAVVCVLASASLIGVPGTAGFLVYSMLFHTIMMEAGWKWLTVVYILLWAFFMTAVVRIFMKLFVSKKEETMRILTTEEERKKADRNVSGKAEDCLIEDRDKNKKIWKHPYFLGEIILLGVGIFQVIVGIFPNRTFAPLGNAVMICLYGENNTGTIPYFAKDALMGFGIAVLLCIVFYLNLVYGILLRTIRNKKNRRLKEGL